MSNYEDYLLKKYAIGPEGDEYKYHPIDDVPLHPRQKEIIKTQPATQEELKILLLLRDLESQIVTVLNDISRAEYQDDLSDAKITMYTKMKYKINIMEQVLNVYGKGGMHVTNEAVQRVINNF
jgi:hypothetical protein